MRKYLNVDGTNLADFGVYISGGGTFSAPDKNVEFKAINGRNGDILISNKRYNNLTVKYPAFIFKNIENNIAGLRNFLLSRDGYVRIEDSYHSDEFRLGAFVDSFDPDMVDALNAGEFDLVFNCKPQRYLKSGEQVKTYTADGTIFNPEYMTALPLLRIYGAGTVGIGSETLTIASHEYDYIDIDCNIQDAFYGTTNCNSLITLSSGDFPVLLSGENGVALGDGITQIDIIPRWWRL